MRRWLVQSLNSAPGENPQTIGIGFPLQDAHVRWRPGITSGRRGGNRCLSAFIRVHLRLKPLPDFPLRRKTGGTDARSAMTEVSWPSSCFDNSCTRERDRLRPGPLLRRRQSGRRGSWLSSELSIHPRGEIGVRYPCLCGTVDLCALINNRCSGHWIYA